MKIHHFKVFYTLFERNERYINTDYLLGKEKIINLREW